MKTLTFLLVMLLGTIGKANPPPEPKPFEQLPPPRKSAEGKASMYFDWSKDPQRLSIVDRINHTAKPVDLVIAYGRIRLDGEVETKPQRWERAPVPQSEQCGTGIGKFQLLAGSC